ncbi:hypothetical protein BLOT_007151 [Blomia tropicalis]|nr:hypothetical protein BLOT_007151 [Blomia tropicalis]
MSTITQALGRLDPRNRRKHTHRNTHDKGKQFGSDEVGGQTKPKKEKRNQDEILMVLYSNKFTH